MAIEQIKRFFNWGGGNDEVPFESWEAKTPLPLNFILKRTYDKMWETAEEEKVVGRPPKVEVGNKYTLILYGAPEKHFISYRDWWQGDNAKEMIGKHIDQKKYVMKYDLITCAYNEPPRGPEDPPFDIAVEIEETSKPAPNVTNDTTGPQKPPSSPSAAAPSPKTRVMAPSPKTRAENQPLDPQAWLNVVKGSVCKDWTPLPQDNITYIGRGEEHRREDGSIWRQNHFAFKDGESEQTAKINEIVSRPHAEIHYSDGAYRLLVTEGRNITKIVRGDEEILVRRSLDTKDAVPLQNGDIIRVQCGANMAEARFTAKT